MFIGFRVLFFSFMGTVGAVVCMCIFAEFWGYAEMNLYIYIYVFSIYPFFGDLT